MSVTVFDHDGIDVTIFARHMLTKDAEAFRPAASARALSLLLSRP